MKIVEHDDDLLIYDDNGSKIRIQRDRVDAMIADLFAYASGETLLSMSAIVHDLQPRPTDADTLSTALEPYRTKSAPVKRTKRNNYAQSLMRAALLTHYGSRCMFTKKETEEVTEAAHIHSVASGGNYSVCNGLLISSDEHILFDANLIGLDTSFSLHLHRSIKDHKGLNDTLTSWNGAPIIADPKAIAERWKKFARQNKRDLDDQEIKKLIDAAKRKISNQNLEKAKEPIDE